MIILNDEDIYKVICSLSLPLNMESRLSINYLTYTNKNLQLPSLEVVGVYKKRVQGWFQKLLRYHIYDLVGIKTPLAYTSLEESVDSAYIRDACMYKENDSFLNTKDFYCFNRISIGELLNDVRI